MTETFAASREAYLRRLGVATLPRATCAFDPGYDLGTVQAHIRQSGHLMSGLKISMACWQLAAPSETAAKVAAARAAGVPVITGEWSV